MATPAHKAPGGGRGAASAARSVAATPSRPQDDEIVKRLEEDLSQLRKHVASPIAHPHGAPSAAGPSLSDNTTSHVDVLLATLVVKMNEIASKFEAVGAATTEATSRIVVGSNAAETAKLQAELAVLRTAVGAVDSTAHALQPLVKDGHKAIGAQLSHLEKLVADRVGDVSARVERHHGVLAAYVERAAAAPAAQQQQPVSTRPFEAALEQQLAKLTAAVESRVAAASDSHAAAVGRHFAESDAALAKRFSALAHALDGGQDRARAAVVDRSEWTVKQVQGSQGPAFDAINARLDKLTEAIEGMQARFMSSLGGLAGQQAKDLADLRAAVAASEHAAAKQFAGLASALEHARTAQAAAAQQLAAVSKHAEGGRADAQAARDKVDDLVKHGLPRLLAEAREPVLAAQASTADAALKHTQKLLSASTAEHIAAASKAADQHGAALTGHHKALVSDVKALVDDALNGHSQAAARLAATTAAEAAAQAERHAGSLEQRIAALEAAVASGFAASDRDHTAAAASSLTLRDGVWKGFDDAAAHRRELAGKTAADLAGVRSHVDAVATVARATSAAVEGSLTGTDAPLRKAADATLALLPGVSQTVSIIAGTTGSLTGAVADATSKGHPSVEAAVQAARADVKAAVAEARASLGSYVMGVQSSVNALSEQCGHLATAAEQRAAAASLQALHDGVWKGFDEAAAHRRELAGKAAADLTGVRSHVDSAVRPVVEATQELRAVVDGALASSDAPVRRAADASSALLPGIAETVSLLASQQQQLQQQLLQQLQGSAAAAAAAAPQSGAAEALLAQQQRTSDALLAQQLRASEALQELRDGVWKGFDEAAAHRRELAGKTSADLAGVRSHVDAAVSAGAAPAHAARDAAHEVLAALRPIDARVAELHDDRHNHASRALRHAEALAELAQTARDGHAASAKSEELGRHAAERTQQHAALLSAIDALRDALSAKATGSAAGTAAELERLGGGLQELSDRVDALAQAYYGTNDSVLDRLGELQRELAGLRGGLAAAAAPTAAPAAPVPTSPPQAEDGGTRAAAAAAAQQQHTPHHDGGRRESSASSAMRLLLSTREEEALRRHLLRVGGAGRYYNAKPPVTPVADSEGGGGTATGLAVGGGSGGSSSSHADGAHHHLHHHHQHHNLHAGGGHAFGGVGEEEDSLLRYQEALRATGHKVTDRYVPAAALASSSASAAAAQSRSAARRSAHNQSGTNLSAGAADSVPSGSGSFYNRHVHHSFGSLPLRSPATQTYYEHHYSPPHGAGDEQQQREGGGGDSARSAASAAQPYADDEDAHAHAHLFDPSAARGGGGAAADSADA